MDVFFFFFPFGGALVVLGWALFSCVWTTYSRLPDCCDAGSNQSGIKR